MPYTIEDYENDAEAILRERIAELRERGMGLTVDPILKVGVAFDSKYASRWSVLTRKYKSGFLVQKLIDFAEKHDVDMTPTLAMRVLQGWVGRSISNRVLIDVFGNEGRDASNKSRDWHRLDELIEADKEAVVAEYEQCAAECKKAKERAWDKVKPNKK